MDRERMNGVPLIMHHSIIAFWSAFSSDYTSGVRDEVSTWGCVLLVVGWLSGFRSISLAARASFVSVVGKRNKMESYMKCVARLCLLICL